MLSMSKTSLLIGMEHSSTVTLRIMLYCCRGKTKRELELGYWNGISDTGMFIKVGFESKNKT